MTNGRKAGAVTERGEPVSASNGQRKRTLGGRLRKWEGYVWVLPALAVMAVLVVYPTVYALWASLTDWNIADPAGGMEFVGVSNYVEAFQDELFVRALINTAFLVFSAVALEFIVGIALAVLLSQPLFGARLARAIILAPTMVAMVVAGLIWRYMYFADYGIVPFLLSKIGISVGGGILATKGVSLAAIIGIDVWQWTPFVAVVTLAGLHSMPQEPLESANIDGASAWQTFRHITLPMLRPLLLVVLLLRAIDAWKTFDIVYATTRGGPGESTMTVTYVAWQQALKFFEMGYGSALAFIILFVALIGSQILIRGVYRDV
jgi:multiple sugar transport system permease protein